MGEAAAGGGGDGGGTSSSSKTVKAGDRIVTNAGDIVRELVRL